MAVDLTVDITGIPLRNPVLTAAGPTSRDGETLAEAARGGVGGLVAKTISVKPAEVPRPNMQTLDRGKSQWLLATWIAVEAARQLGDDLALRLEREALEVGPDLEARDPLWNNLALSGPERHSQDTGGFGSGDRL